MINKIKQEKRETAEREKELVVKELKETILELRAIVDKYECLSNKIYDLERELNMMGFEWYEIITIEKV